MKRITLTCLLVLLPTLSAPAAEIRNIRDEAPVGGPQHGIPEISAISEGRRFAFNQPALWYGDAGGSRDTGPVPDLSSDKWRLLLSDQGLHYVERSASASSEVLSIPYEKIAAVRADPAERAYPTLVVALADRADEPALSHVFLIMHPGSADAPSAATEAKILIEDRMRKGPGSLAQAPSPAMEQKIPTGPETPHAVREEKIAISAAQWQPTIEFGEPEPVQSGSPNHFTDSVSAGAAIGALPLAACSTGLCPPEALVPALALVATGAVAGAIVGIGRELAAAFGKAPSPPPAFSPQEVQAATPHISTTVVAALGQPALHECVQRKLFSGADRAGSVQWTDGTRTASLSPVAGAGPFSPGEAAPYPDLSRGGFRYFIEGSLSKVLIVPEGIPDQRAEDVLAAIVVEGSLQFVDPENGQSQQRSVRWRAEPRTLRDWSAADGAALNDTLKKACEELAGQFVAEAEGIWRNR